MRELTRIEILYVISLIVSCALFIFSVGLLLGIGKDVVVPYAALSVAIVLSLTLIVGILKSKKTVPPPPADSKPVMPVVKAPIEKPVNVAVPAVKEPTVQKRGSNYGEEKIEPIEQLITLPPEDRKIQESVMAAQVSSEIKPEEQKAIKPPETVPATTDTAKSTANKKAANKQKPKRKK